MCCTNWCHLYNLKNVKKTHGGVLLKETLLHECFYHFFNYIHGTKSFKASHLSACDKTLSVIIMSPLRSIFQWYQRRATCINYTSQRPTFKKTALIWKIYSYPLELFNYTLTNCFNWFIFSVHFSINPLMPGGNKKVTHT